VWGLLQAVAPTQPHVAASGEVSQAQELAEIAPALPRQIRTITNRRTHGCHKPTRLSRKHRLAHWRKINQMCALSHTGHDLCEATHVIPEHLVNRRKLEVPFGNPHVRHNFLEYRMRIKVELRSKKNQSSSGFDLASEHMQKHMGTHTSHYTSSIEKIALNQIATQF